MTPLIIIYIVCCILSYGMITASWYWHYEQEIYDVHGIYDYYAEIIVEYKHYNLNTVLYTILSPIGILASIWILIDEECPYWFKWSYKPLKKLQEDIIAGKN